MTDGRASAPGAAPDDLARPESERDQVESSFTTVLRGFFRAHRAVQCAVFVDFEGECIDYCTDLDPFDAKIVAAHMSMVISHVREPVMRMMGGEVLDFFICGDERDLLIRRISDEYLVAVAVDGGGTDEALLDDVETVVKRLRGEIGEGAPFWDARSAAIRVDIREAVGWAFAPRRIVRAGEEELVETVMGRWEEAGGLVGGKLTCFRVRTSQGVERTLAFDAKQRRWFGWA